MGVQRHLKVLGICATYRPYRDHKPHYLAGLRSRLRNNLPAVEACASDSAGPGAVAGDSLDLPSLQSLRFLAAGKG